MKYFNSAWIKANKFKAGVIFVAAIFVIMLIANFGGEEIEDVAQDKPWGETFTLKEEPYQDQLRISGELSPLNTVEVSAEWSGRIGTLAVDVGDTVGVNQTIGTVTIDPTIDDEVGIAVANLNIAEANLQIARQNIIKLEQSEKTNSATGTSESLKNTLLRLFNREQEAQAVVTKTLIDLQQAQEAVAVAEADHFIISPFVGVVTDKYAEVGQVINFGDPVFTIADDTVLIIEADVPDEYARLIAIGTPATVDFSGFNGVFGATITKILPETDPLSRKLRVELTLINTPLKAKLGTYAKVNLVMPERSTFFVPKKYIFSGTDGPYIELGDGSTKFISRGAERGDEFEITFEGIEEGVNLAFNY